MNAVNKKQIQQKIIEERIVKGNAPILLDVTKIIAAREEIAKLPYGSDNPKAKEIARKYGLKFVPSL